MGETMNHNANNHEIDLQKLFVACLQRWWLIVGSAILGLVVALLYTSYFITPQYRASVTMYVNNAGSEMQIEYITSSNLTASQTLVNTHVNVIRSDRILEKTVERMDLDITPAQLDSMISAAQIGETQLFRLSITHTDPVQAADIVNALADVSTVELMSIIEGSSVKLIDYAKVPTVRHSPNNTKNAMVGAMVGVLLVVLVIVMRELFDVRLREAGDLENMFDIPVLGQIPDFSLQGAKKGYEYARQESPSAAEEEGV